MVKSEYDIRAEEIAKIERDIEQTKVELAELKKQEDLLGLYNKTKRFIKNVGFELIATTLEGIFAPFRLGGLTVGFDGIREKKTPNLYREKRAIFNEIYFPLKF